MASIVATSLTHDAALIFARFVTSDGGDVAPVYTTFQFASFGQCCAWLSRDSFSFLYLPSF